MTVWREMPVDIAALRKEVGLDEAELTLLQRRPDDLIEQTWLGEYETRINTVWDQLAQFNTSMLILDKLLQFRFDLFVEAEHTFWRTVRQALFDSCIMAAWRLVSDNRADVLTLRKLRDAVMQHLTSDKARDELAGVLKQVDFDKTVKGASDRIAVIRHNYIAHLNLEKNTKQSEQEVRNRTSVLSELQYVLESLNTLFQILCFSRERSVLPFHYDDSLEYTAGTDTRTDVDRILDGIARDSVLLNLPERDPSLWAILRAQHTPGDLQIINEYRKRFGLTPA